MSNNIIIIVRIATDCISTDIINNSNMYHSTINNWISSDRNILTNNITDNVIHESINDTIVNMKCIIGDSITITKNNINSHTNKFIEIMLTLTMIVLIIML